MSRQAKTDIYTIGAMVSIAVIWLAAVLSLSGCYNPFDPIYERRGIEVSDTTYVEGQYTAMLLFQMDVEDYFEEDLGDAWLDTRVFWTDTKCGADDNYGIPWEGECYAGLHFSCTEMYVAVSRRDEEHVCGSALVHEFAHCLSNHLGHPGNGTHTGPIWDLVPVATARGCEGRL